MANWQITITGSGPHHAGDGKKDADTLAANAVAALKNAGHQVAKATFTDTESGKQDVLG